MCIEASVRVSSVDVQELEAPPMHLSILTRNLCCMRAEQFRCHILTFPVPDSHDALCEMGRTPVVTTFLTEADSDENCGPEVVPVDTDDEIGQCG